MNKCINCQVTIQTNLNKCPLCNQEIKNEKPNSVYPEIKTSYKAHHILYRILEGGVFQGMTKGTGRFFVFFQINSTQPVLQMVYGFFLPGQI